jgi:hypothetical protein
MVLVVDLGQPKEVKISDPFQYVGEWDFPEGVYSEDVTFKFTVPAGKTYHITMIIAIKEKTG